MPTVIIGIAGGTCSGKTTLTKRIADRFDGRVSVLCHDNYYKPTDSLTKEQRAQLNFDSPEAFDTALLVEDLKRFKRGETVHSPIYDYENHNRRPERLAIEPSSVLIVEGILIFQSAALRELMDIKIFVDTDADERLARRVLRDERERGRTVASVLEQYRTTVKPMHELFVEPSKRFADIILPNGCNDVAFDMLAIKIERLLDA